MNANTKRYALILAGCIFAAGPLVAQVVQPAAPEPTPTSQPAPPPVDPNRVVITLGDQKMTAQEFNDFIGDLPPQVQTMARGPGKRMLADELVKYMMMANEAKKRGLDQTPKFKRQMDVMKEQILASALAAEVQSKIDDAALQKYYDEHKSDYETVKARHILIRSAGSPMPADKNKKELTDDQAKAKAEEIRARIAKGEDFATVAKAESDDKGSGAQGGDLGTFGRGQMVKPFEEAAFAMKPGDISQPVKSPFGYHVIQVQEKTTPAFAQMKEEITAKLGPEKLDKVIAELKKTQKPELDEMFFGPPTTQPVLPPGLPE